MVVWSTIPGVICFAAEQFCLH